MRLFSRRAVDRTALILILTLAAGGPAAAGDFDPAPPSLGARSAILVDQATGRVLYERNADEPFVPASLAKLMALHIVWEKLEDRSIRPDDVVFITTRALAANQEPGSSLMYLEPGQVVTVMDLMRGTAIASGNDAATALAEYAAGSVAKFVRLMNDEARWLGYRTMRFADPAGLSRDNVVTAREFADFCRRYIEWHPQALTEVHSLREFFYPLPRNLPVGSSLFLRSYRVYNPNYLVWDPFGVDGLKTGHLDDENFTAALTAQRGDTRLIAVLLGIPGRGLTEGAKNRSRDGMALFSWGFRTYATVRLATPHLDPIRVWKGEQAAGRARAGAASRGDCEQDRGGENRLERRRPLLACRTCRAGPADRRARSQRGRNRGRPGAPRGRRGGRKRRTFQAGVGHPAHGPEPLDALRRFEVDSRIHKRTERRTNRMTAVRTHALHITITTRGPQR